jgi:RHS repeat-associated protein
VLTSVVFEDESRSDFSYTNWGQVWKIARFAPDGSQLAYTSYNLPGSPLLASTVQTDCPRFSEQRMWALNWNNNAEALTSYSVDAGGGWTEVTLPDRTTKIKEIFSTAANWEKGLTTATEIYSGTRKVKWTTTAWTQDDINIGYQKNPRPREINIYDEAGNRRRTEIIYHPVFGLPNIIKEYAADGTTLLRQTVTDYNLAQVYLDRRVIGLPSKVQVTDENNQYVSKMTYDYDQGGEYLAPMPQAATQHDAANYGTSFVAGRGNLTTVSRWDVTDIDNAAKAVQQRSGYNTTGSVIFTRDALNHQSSISYTDSFFDGNTSRNTFAYPTQATDADSHQSTAQYDYNFGAVTKIQGPPPAGNTQGLVQKLTYDKMLRVTRVSTEFNGAEYYYQRWVYYNDGVTEVAYSSVNNLVDDTYNYTARDGAGNVRATAQYHPGSVGGYSAQITYRDVMNRVVKQSNPTEINASFQNVGDDASGWQWTLQAYDWKGRPTLTTLPGGATVENTYGGCGCAGGEQVTTRDERGRQRKLYKDVLGRLKKVEELNWNGTVYSTTIYDYNARDQMKSITQGNRIRSFDYDGHGRLWKRTTPEQGQLEYKYKTDDTLDWVKDARGVKTIFGYNNRHLVESIAYDLSGVLAGQNVAATPGVSYTYDAAGNRTQMVTAGVSTVNYYYDQLSRMTSETIQFNGFPLPPLHTLAYGYNRAGELTSLTNPFNSTVSYTYDRMGRPTNVNGTGDVSAPAYVSNVSYRAWGAAKQVNYGNTRTLTANYDNRLRMTQWNIAGVLGYDYSYNHNYENSGRVTFARNLTTTQPNSQAAARDATLDRSYDYDHVGRLTSTHTGSEARAAIGEPWSGLYDGPYSQGYVYDQWGNMTERGGWGGENASYAAITFPASNRLPHNPVTGAPVAYDAAGNVTSDGSQTFTYDATGQQTSASGASTQMQYDGDRLRVRKTENAGTVYYIRSSVLGGQVVADATGTGTWVRGYIYVGGQLLAYQENGRVLWVHEEPVTKAKRTTDTQGAVHSITELDPWGGETNRSSGSWLLPHKYTSYERDANGSDEAMHRRYNRLSRFDQPDPYDGSYNLTDPQSFNRYSYVQNDPVNFVDPTGLMCYNVIRTDYYSDTGQVIGSFVVDTFCDTWGGINIGNFDVTVHAGTEPMLNHAPPSQDTNIHGCLTISKILNNPLFAEALAGNWRQTEKSKEENGGWWFYDAAANTLHMNGATEGRHVDLGPPYGVRPSMPKEQDEFMDQFRQFRENGRSVVFIGMFHTHPGGYAHPDQPDYWNLINNPGKSAFPNAFGVIITGVGKYTVYNSRGELSAGDPRRDECLN